MHKPSRCRPRERGDLVDTKSLVFISASHKSSALEYWVPAFAGTTAGSHCSTSSFAGTNGERIALSSLIAGAGRRRLTIIQGRRPVADQGLVHEARTAALVKPRFGRSDQLGARGDLRDGQRERLGSNDGALEPDAHAARSGRLPA